MAKFEMSGLEAFGHFAISLDGTAIACGFFSRSKTKVRGIAANFGKRDFRFNWHNCHTDSSNGWTGVFSPQNIGRDKFTYCLCINQDIGNKYLVTSSPDCDNEWYDYLMLHYKLPLKREWIPVIRDTLISQSYVSMPQVKLLKATKAPVILSLRDKDFNISDIVVYSFNKLNEELFESTVSGLLSTGQISITKKIIPSLSINGLDDYFSRFGSRIVENLDKELIPLVDLRANVRNLALKQKSLFPQQAASVEGILAMERHGIRYAVLNHGCGCGKTIEAAAAVEAIMVEKWLKQNPDKILKDAYAKEGIIKYRTLISAPALLVNKWAQEIKKDIPYANTVILNNFSQLVELRKSGRKPAGKEFFIISKDFCKLDSQISPIPSQIKAKYISIDICSNCKNEQNKIIYKKGFGDTAVCPSCKGRKFEAYVLPGIKRHKGFICPKCGELLLKYKGYNPDDDEFAETLKDCVLTPASFARANTSNSHCYHCNAPLWGTNARPLVTGNAKIREPKWYRVSHYTNHTKKSKRTAFVFRGYEDFYYKSCITTEGLTVLSSQYGPRKVAPAHYIKKYLKNYFDFCILDECHQYLGESAQAVAAHALVKASRFTLALTGTLSNGTASCFYSLFWMLEPKRMIDMGYSYTSHDMIRFCKEFGCVETIYEAHFSEDREKNVCSRGKQISDPKVKPGISPVLFGKLLIDRCLFMDISDLSKYLPKLREEVMLVKLPPAVDAAYFSTIENLKASNEGKPNLPVLSAMLQFGLSYPDKPYGYSPIINPFGGDTLSIVKNFNDYSQPDILLPKEKKLIELVNEEMSQGRGVFVYAVFSGKAETNVSYRLKDILERHCFLKDKVEIIQSASPAASKREEWFHRRASEGIKVFITNPINVETGLDFCFKHNGVDYNYPTIIFYQIGFSLFTVWQASRRAYRLIQKEMCRVIYLAYEDTLQAAAIAIMAKKQVAASAIQGHFTAEGLSSMAQGIDVRTQLAAALSQNDMSSRESLEGMFDVLKTANEAANEDLYNSFTPSKTFEELVGTQNSYEEEYADAIFTQNIDDISNSFIAQDFCNGNLAETSTEIKDDFLSFFTGFTGLESGKTLDVAPKRKNKVTGQMSIFDFGSI